MSLIRIKTNEMKTLMDVKGLGNCISKLARKFMIFFILLIFASLLVGCGNKSEVKLSVSGYSEQLSDDGKVYYAITISNEGEEKVKISTVTPLMEHDMPLPLEIDKNKVGTSINSGEEQIIEGEFIVKAEGYSQDDISEALPLIKKYEVEIDNKIYVLKAVN